VEKDLSTIYSRLKDEDSKKYLEEGRAMQVEEAIAFAWEEEGLFSP